MLLLLALLAAYPGFVFGSVYSITLQSELPGGRHGPRDAYRHCLASAIVAYTTSTHLVDLVTNVIEGHDAGQSHRMDAHNNRIGASIGASATSWAELLRTVRTAVDRGCEAFDADRMNAEPARVVWLSRGYWRDGWF